MEKRLEILNGNILFQQEQLVITDTAKRDKAFGIFTAVFMMAYGFYAFRSQPLHPSQWAIGINWFLVSLGGLLLVSYLLRSAAGKIACADMKSIALKKRWDNEYYIDIKLRSKQLRRVVGVDDPEAVQAMIDTLSLPTTR